MDTRVISQALRNQPFQPFTIRMADGRAIPIPHPDFVAVFTRLAIVIDPATEAVTWLEPLLIQSIECAAGVAPTPPAASHNGGDNA